MYLPAIALKLSPRLKEELEKFARDRSSPHNMAQRCWIVLMAAEGIGNNAIARTLKISRTTVLLWRQRFEIFGKDILLDPSHSLPGRPPSLCSDERSWIKEEARHQLQQGRSLREIGIQLKISKSTLHRILSGK